jgi:hypothetical protein
VTGTVLLKSIRQSRVTRVLDVTNFATLSRVTEALDEFTFRHDRFKILVQGRLEQFSLAVGTFHSISCPFSVHFQGFCQESAFKPRRYRDSEQVQLELSGKKCIFPPHSRIC